MSRENHPEICRLLFEQVKQPDNLERCWAINVYSNKYRVNVYTTKYDEFWDVERVRITQSYFCKMTDNELKIIA